jgi:tRNA A-37 threonylcarbamoyl transferase component Bud32
MKTSQLKAAEKLMETYLRECLTKQGVSHPTSFKETRLMAELNLELISGERKLEDVNMNALEVMSCLGAAISRIRDLVLSQQD